MAKDKGPDKDIIKELIFDSARDAALETEGVCDVLDVKGDIDHSQKKVELKIYIYVYFGSKIPAVSWDVQNAVKNAVKSSADFTASSIDIHIQGIQKRKDQNV